MRRGFIVVLAAVLVGAFALPAMAANVDLNGFIRIKPMLSNTKGNPLGNYTIPKSGTDNNGVKQTQTNAYVDQRARLKFTVGDENVKFVAFFESDNFWGDTAYDVGRNKGGGLMADTVQLETKNMYVWYKIPDTPMDFTVGLQGFSDVYQGAILNPAVDFAGVIGNFRGPVAFRFGGAKLWESSIDKATDANFYLAEAQFSPTKEAKVGLNLYFIQSGGATQPSTLSVNTLSNNGNFDAIWTPNEIKNGLASGKKTYHIWIPGVNFSANAGPVTLSGFALYEFGDVKSNGVSTVGSPFTKIKVGGFAGDLRADFNGIIPGGKLFVEGVYASGDDNRTDDKYKAVLTGQNFGNVGAATVYRTDMYILGGNGDDITTNSGLANDIGNGGAGMIHFAAGYTQQLVPKLTCKVGAGWLRAADKRQHDGTINNRTADYMAHMNFANDTAMGTEVNVFLNYNIYKGLDFGVVGAYAWLGKAYKPATAFSNVTVTDPDNLYDVHARLNYAF